jgi:hypothetical protein
MGFIRDTKVATIGRHAREARDEGRQVFVARIWEPVTSPGLTGPVGDVAEQVEEIEAAGWRLDHMAYSWIAQKKRGHTIMLFRRSG